MNSPGQPIAPTFDAEQAVQYGLFVEMTYTMYDNAPTNPMPTPPSPFITDYKFIAWVQMRDFVFEDGSWMFYGLLAQHTSKANEFVLAIRGTSNLTEWLDDITSMVSVPLNGWGQVGYGFNRIYQTLRLVDYTTSTPLAATAMPTQPVGTFAQQVAAAVQRHAALAKPQDRTATEAAPAPMSVEVTGHGLGAALATLYVAENAASSAITTPLLCTFASPRVGDSAFAARFDQLGITSWRIVNELDIVPKLPAIGFTHVVTEYSYTSGSSVDWSLSCWHELATYLNLLDATQPISPECRWPQQSPVAATSLRAAPKLAAQAVVAVAPTEKEISLQAPSGQGGTINITTKIGGTD
jgi:hypothetical protein